MLSEAIMFDWFWQLLALVGAAAAAIFGLLYRRQKHKAEREQTERQIGQDDLLKRSQEQLETTRRRYAHQAPVDPSKRTDFEHD